MASNRSNARTRNATPSAAVATPSQALKTLARRATRTQIVACSAAAMTFTGWAAASGQLAQTFGDELLHRLDGETDSNELIARVADATTCHLRDLTSLTRAAADHFDTRLARSSTYKEIHHG